MSTWQFLVGLWHALQPLVLIAVGWFVLLVGPPLRGRIKNTEARQWLELIQQVVEWAVLTVYQQCVRKWKDPNNTAAGEWNPEKATEAKERVLHMVHLAVPQLIAALKARGYAVDSIIEMQLESKVHELNQRLSMRPPVGEAPEVRVAPQSKVPADLVQGIDPVKRTISGAFYQAVAAETTQQLRALRDTPPEIPGAKK